MTVILIEFSIVLIGLLFTAILFYRLPVLPAADKKQTQIPTISVIIPARNEGMNLSLLLSDLSRQTIPILEIICVDDNSTDATAAIAIKHGAGLLSAEAKPDDWVGKTWACQKGADAAAGELLLFLDADVRLAENGVQLLLQAYLKSADTLSVQPYHVTENSYEQLSLLFNLVQIGANGVGLPRPLGVGLYGPVILMTKEDYYKAGGHEGVKSCVVEDMALGEQLRKIDLPFNLYLGNRSVSFRMYPGGFRDLFLGWIKNMATGAIKTPLPVFFMIFFWITSLTSVPIQLVKSAVTSNMIWLAIYVVLYFTWVVVLSILTKQVGRFQLWAIFLYPIPLVVFLVIFFVSSFRKLFRLKVVWKGREIEMGKKPCE